MSSIPALAEQAIAAVHASAVSTDGQPTAPVAIELRYKLDDLPAAMQFLLDSGDLTTDHVAYQSMHRLCFGALGLLKPDDRHDTLLEFNKTLQANFGRGPAHLMHGAGFTGTGGGEMTRAEYLHSHNFGFFSPRTVRCHFPAPPKRPGLQLSDTLNLFAAAALRGQAVTWEPVLADGTPAGVTLYMLDIGHDGMLLKQGTTVDESTLEVCGFGE